MGTLDKGFTVNNKDDCLHPQHIHSQAGSSILVPNPGYSLQNYVATPAWRDYLHSHCHEKYSLYASEQNL